MNLHLRRAYFAKKYMKKLFYKDLRKKKPDIHSIRIVSKLLSGFGCGGGI